MNTIAMEDDNLEALEKAWEEAKTAVPTPADSEEHLLGQLTLIRTLSNVINALENVVTQCEGRPEFERLAGAAARDIDELRAAMKRAIHAA